MDVLREEDSTDMETDDVYVTSAFSIKKDEPEVSLIFRFLEIAYVCICMYEISCWVLMNSTIGHFVIRNSY
jgi:hypothetical protein